MNTWTYILWETDRARPTVHHFPAIFSFLGYDPFPAPTSLAERLASKRRHLGLPLKKAALLVGVDEGTFMRWERGEREPCGRSAPAIDRFLTASR